MHYIIFHSIFLFPNLTSLSYYDHLLHNTFNFTCTFSCPLYSVNQNNFSYLIFSQILAIPAIPLTMSAGLLFGSVVGTIIVSISGTVSQFGSYS